MSKQFYVYILASKHYGTLYIGVTSDLIKRIYQHKSKNIKGFSEKYDVDKLVYYEAHESAEAAIKREKQIKKWNRDWKIELIEACNPHWQNIYCDIV